MIEASSPAGVREKLETYGVALWKGLAAPEVVQSLYATATADADRMRFNGVLHFPTREVAELAVTPEIDSVFTEMLGKFSLIAGKWESCFLFADHKIKPTVWHQECETVDPRALIVWVALEDCGVDAAGLSVIAKKLSGADPVFEPDDVTLSSEKQALLERLKWPVITPEFKSGDAVFLTPFTIHKTHLVPGMSKRRLAYKLTAVPKC